MTRITTLMSALAGALLVALLPAQAPQLPNFDRRTPVVLAVENVGPAVVSIKTQSKVDLRHHPFGGLFQRWDDENGRGGDFADRSVGSGVIIHPLGYVVTNDHVVAGADRIFVTLGVASEGKPATYEAALLNSDVDNDLAVLRIQGKGPFPYALFGDSDDLLVGETTIALGCPFGIGASVTTGVLSARNRPVVFRGKEVFRDFIQTSALIHPGNSGGPLLDVNGRVIGINVAIDLRGAGIGYAIPSNRARDVATQLLDPQVVRRAALGLELEAANGVLRVSQVDKDGPAARAGVREGDVVAAVAGAPVAGRLDFNLAVLEQPPGAAVPFRLRRGDQTAEVSVPFVPQPLSALSQRRFDALGFAVADVDARIAREFKLERTGGVVITDVVKDGAADRIELKAGDLVYQVGRYRVGDGAALAEALRYYGRTRDGAAEIHILREGRPLRGALSVR